MRFSSLLLLVTSTTLARGQTIQFGRAAVSSDSVPTTIQMAELEGARYPRSTEPDSAQVMIRTRHADGTPEHRCVEVGDSPWVQSGGFVVARFNEYSKRWYAGQPKLAWVPLHPNPAAPAPLLVRAVRLDDDAPRLIFERPGVLAHQMGSLTDFGYPSFFSLPTVGRWMFVARAGSNWGCFIYELT